MRDVLIGWTMLLGLMIGFFGFGIALMQGGIWGLPMLALGSWITWRMMKASKQ